MIRPILTLLLATLAATARSAGDPYAAALIPATLTENANAVKRAEEIRYEIVPMAGARKTHHWVVTVLNEAGRSAASFREYYGKLFRFESVEGTLYDAQGKVLRRVRTKDVGDGSAVDDGSLMTDTRVRYHDFEYPTYPYTVEYTVETSSRTTLFFPTWVPQNDEQLSVVQSSITIVTPVGFGYRFKAFRLPAAPVEKTGSVLERTWSAQNLPAIDLPFAAPLWRELTPMVVFAADRFTYGDYQGSSENWNSFGAFIGALNKGRDELPPALKQKVHAIADGITDPREKARQLYRFLQQNTRYISIQMGIGGLQTFEARFVAEKGYGDCKALSNYMYSLLKEAGVPAHYAVINSGERAGDRELIEELPFSQFDHVVLCVPFPKDSLWLECTSQTKTPGYMGSFTGNRKALLITADGGQLAATPRYTFRDNRQLRQIAGSVSAEGHLEVKNRTLFRGEQQDDLAGFVQVASREQVKKYLDEQLGLSSAYEVVAYHYAALPAALPELEEQLTLYVGNYASASGKRLFITPNIANRANRELTAETRTLPVCLRENYSDTDSVGLTVPAGYTVETLPKPVQLRTPYGNYSVSCSFEGNKLRYVRQRDAWAGTFPPAEWENVKAFFNAVYKSDRARVVLVKQ